MTTARQKVLAHLKNTRAARAREIARALKMSAPNVRHHLSVLCSDGRVEFTAVNNRDGRGRPEKLYSLSQVSLGDNLSGLADALLTEAGKKLNIESLASHILETSQFANLPLTKQLPLIIKKLNEINYQSRWEAGADGPRVIFGRCPYAQIIDSHPEICKMDTAMLEMALARRVTQHVKNETGLPRLCPFIFKVGEVK